MATMAIPMSYVGDSQFADVEDTVDAVKAGVKFTNRTGFAVRVIAKTTFLRYVFAQAIEKQGKLIDMLNAPTVQGFSANHLLSGAEKIEHLVRLNDDLLTTVYPGKFEPWNRMLVQLADQRDTLESIAESFRAACDPEHQELLIATLEAVYA